MLVANRLGHDFPEGDDDQGTDNEGSRAIPKFRQQNGLSQERVLTPGLQQSSSLQREHQSNSSVGSF